MHDLGRKVGPLEAVEDLVHRLGQVGLRHTLHGGHEEEVDRERAAARARRADRLGGERQDDPSLLEPAGSRLARKGDARRRELAVRRDVVVEGIRCRRRGDGERRGRPSGRRGRLLLGRREDAEGAVRFARRRRRGRRRDRGGGWEGRRRDGRLARDGKVDREGEVLVAGAVGEGGASARSTTGRRDGRGRTARTPCAARPCC